MLSLWATPIALGHLLIDCVVGKLKKTAGTNPFDETSNKYVSIL